MHIPGLLLFLKLWTSTLLHIWVFWGDRVCKCAIDDTVRSSQVKMRCTLGWEFGENLMVMFTIVRSASQIHASLLSICLTLRKCKDVFQWSPKLGEER